MHDVQVSRNYLPYDKPSPNLKAGFSESKGTSSSCFLTASIDEGISKVSLPMGLNLPNTMSRRALSSASNIMIAPFATSLRSEGSTQLEPAGLKATTTGLPVLASFLILSHFAAGNSILTSLGATGFIAAAACPVFICGLRAFPCPGLGPAPGIPPPKP